MQYRFTKEDWVAVILFTVLVNSVCQFIAFKLLDLEVYFAVRTLNLGVFQAPPYRDARLFFITTFCFNVFLVLLALGAIIFL